MHRTSAAALSTSRSTALVPRLAYSVTERSHPLPSDPAAAELQASARPRRYSFRPTMNLYVGSLVVAVRSTLSHADERVIGPARH
jgi:hypothetical protein